MSVIDDTRSTYAPRMQRRHDIVTTGGMAGALCVGDALREFGLPVRDFTVDVRDGVPYGTVICTIAVTDAESIEVADRIGALPAVISVDSY